MRYRNAKAVLPEALLAELQKYCQGELIYIPNCDRKAGWGCVNGSRERYTVRNRQIVEHHRDGAAVDELARQFFLSRDSIKKIIKNHTDG